MKRKLLTLLLSLAMIVTYMPVTAFAADGEAPAEGDEYELALFVNGEPNDVTISQGDAITLEAKLFHRYTNENNDFVEEEIPKDEVNFNLDVVENVMFDGHELEDNPNPIFDNDSFGSSADGVWTAESIVDKPEDSDELFTGIATFHISATYNGDSYDVKWDRNVGVGCRIDYNNTQILAGNESIDNSKLEAILPEMEEGDTIVVDPTCNSDKVTHYKFELQRAVENPQFVDFPSGYGTVSGNATNAVLLLTKQNIQNIVSGTDLGFQIRVSAMGMANIGNAEVEAAYARNVIDVTVDDGKLDIFQEYHIEGPSAIPYSEDATNSVYEDAVSEFHLVSNDGTNTEANEEADKFEWRFVDANPDTLLTEEDGERASVRTNENSNDLRLDHYGTYWVVAAGIGDYRGYIIQSFQLTDEDHYYKRKPFIREEITYTEGSMALVCSGDANQGTVQYRYKPVEDEDFGGYSESVPTVTSAGEYDVSFCIMDGQDQFLEETTRVRIVPAPINIVLNNATKVYGTADPEDYTQYIDLSKSSQNIESVASEIKFSRESGEDVNGTGYRIYAHYEDPQGNYVAYVKNSRLTITKADYRLSVTDRVSFDCSGDACKVPYYSDGVDPKIELQDGSKLHATVRNGILTLEADEVCSENITLVIPADRNHFKKEKSIHVEVTNSVATASGDAATVSSMSGDATDFGEGVTLSVEPKEQNLLEIATNFVKELLTVDNDETATEYTSKTYSITLNNSQGEVSGNAMRIAVKIKLEGDDLGKLIGCTEPKAVCNGAEAIATWFEEQNGDYYICFETTHLSDWKFTATEPIDINTCEFNLPDTVVPTVRFADEDNGIKEYYDINFIDALKTASGDPVNPECYNLKFALIEDPDGSPTSYDLDKITTTGLYKVKAEAVVGKGYFGEIIFNGTINVEETQHSFRDEWSKNNLIHWHECDGECGVASCDATCDEGEHVFEGQERPDAAYLVSKATCVEYAKYYKVCECGAVSTETYSYINERDFRNGRLKDHDLELIEPEDGDAYYRCRVCCQRFTPEEVAKEVLRRVVIAGTVVVGATVATVAIVKTVDALVKEAKAAKEAEEAARLLEDAKLTAQQAMNEALGGSIDPTVNELFNKGYEAIAAAVTPDEVMNATVEYVNLISQAETVLETKITQNKLQALKNGKIKVTFVNPEIEGTVSYQVVRSNKKDFSKNLKKHTVKAADKATLVYTNTKNLKKGIKYYYKVRAKVQLSDGTVVWTDWSKVRSVTCKKTR